MMIESFKLYLKMFYNKFRFSFLEEKIRTMVVFVIGSLFFIGTYIMSYYVIMYISNLPIIGTIFMLKIIALLLLTSFMMLIFSSLINSFATIYNSDDIEFLVSLPIRLENIFLTKFFGTYVKSVWMLLVLLVPFLIAFSWIKDFSIIGFSVVLVSLFIMMLISVLIGILVSIFLSYFFPSKKLRNIVLVMIILIATIGYTVFRFLEPEKLLNPDRFQELVQYLDFLSKPVAKILPSWWVAEILRGYLSKNYNLVYVNILKLVFVAIVFFCVMYFFAKKMFYNGLFNNKDFKHKKNFLFRNISVKLFQTKFLRNIILHLRNSQLFTMIVKDLKLFLREPVQWTQIVIVIALIIVYIFSITKIPIQYQYVKSIISFFNLGSIMFMLTSMSLRFIFVQPSLDYKMFWLLKAAPVKSSQVFCSKIILFLPMLTIFGWIVIFISNILLNLGIFMWIISFVIITIASFVLGVSAYSLGILFPKIDFSDIVQIETSFGGLVYIILSLCYIVLVLTSIAYPVRQYILWQKVSFDIILFRSIDFILINLLYLVPAVYFSYKKFKLSLG